MINPFQTYSVVTSETHLAQAIQNLLNGLEPAGNCVSLVFFGSATVSSYENILAEIRMIVVSNFGYAPLVSFIPQPLCGGFTFGLEAMYVNESTSQPELKKSGNVHYAIFQVECGEMLILEAVSATNLKLSYAEQSVEVFEKINSIFQTEHVDTKHIVRQWNYIGDIVGFENGNQHYQLFNNARSEFYKNIQFQHGFPAATGISMSVNSLLVSVIAIVPTGQTTIYAVDNSLQKPAYNYSAEVLVEGESVKLKTTPKFERGKLVVCDNMGVFFISGTAAIRDERSLHVNDVEMQTRETIENINFLLSNENLRLSNVKKDCNLTLDYVRVYLKNRSDYDAVKKIVVEAWPTIKTIFVQAEVCRPELLVEIEGIAQ
jgi:enamine deaminase RidA (YjgF/YER057c/UK114 family)